MKRAISLAILPLALALGACGADDGPGVHLDGTGSDAVDAPDSWDAIDGTDTGVDPPVDPGIDTGPSACGEKSYIWIANSAEGTLSKLCTLDGVEKGRYITSPQGASGDPSRTSVNLHGDMVVTNRDPGTGPSSVTKFAAESYDCLDRNGDTIIQTSTGGDDVLAWGEDECMIWNTSLPVGGGAAMGCRATAWQGDEDPETGLGGHVWIGCMMNQRIYEIDGDTGEVLGDWPAGLGPYGGAMDGLGNFWTVAMTCTVMLCRLSRLNMETHEYTIFDVPCGYGISVDRLGRIWTAGLACVNRLDPVSGTNTTYRAGAVQIHRGVAVDDEGSVWVAVTGGSLIEVDETTVDLVGTAPLGASEVVGVAIDFQGYVWAVSQGSNQAIKVDPDTYEVERFTIGSGPYTYSDMTGYQLSIVEIPF
jgi:streptogramin lyase